LIISGFPALLFLLVDRDGPAEHDLLVIAWGDQTAAHAMRKRRVIIFLTVLAALLFAAAWLVTARVGAPAVRESLVSGARSEFRDVSGEPGQHSHGKPPWFYCRTSAAFPFIVRVETGWLAQPLMGGGSESLYFWFFGTTVRIRHTDTWQS
jgi:hypothetical protein